MLPIIFLFLFSFYFFFFCYLSNYIIVTIVTIAYYYILYNKLLIKNCDVISHVMVTQSHNTKKNIKGSETDNIILYINNILILYIIHGLLSRLDTV